MEKSQFIQFVQDRTKSIAKQLVFLLDSMPQRTVFFVIGKQLLRAATSTAANYRAVSRARSKNEFYAKISIVVEECDETLFWLEILEETELLEKINVDDLKNDVLQVLKIVSKARKNTYVN